MLSLYWLLEDPLILAARLDISDSYNLHGLSSALQKSGITTLGQMLTLAGNIPAFGHYICSYCFHLFV